MRTLSGTIQTALDNPLGIRLYSRMTAYKSRFTFDTVTDRCPIGWRVPVGVNEDANISNVQWDLLSNRMLTVVPMDGHVNMLFSDSGVPLELSAQTTSDILRIGFHVSCDMVDLLFYGHLAYDFNGDLIWITINKEQMNLRNPNCMDTYVVVEEDVPHRGICHIVSPSQFVYLYLDDGGIGIANYTTEDGGETWLKEVFQRRIMVPEQIITIADIKLLNYSAAVQTSYGLFVYLTMPDGSVTGVKKNNDGVWEDIFTAIPQDLSKFGICNAVVDAFGRIHISGQLSRVKEFNHEKVFNLVPWSDDGITFTMDRSVGVSSLGYRFQIAIGAGNTVAFSDMNTFNIQSGGYPMFRANAPKTVIPYEDIVSIDGDLGSSLSVQLSNGDEKYLNALYLDEGSICHVDVGVQMANDIEWMRYETCIISGKSIEYPSRRLVLQMVQEGMWRVSTMNYPFYLEIASKSSIRDNVSTIDDGNMAAFTSSGGITEPFSINFFQDVNGFLGGGLTTGNHGANSNKVYVSGDAKKRTGSKSYPTIDNLPMTVKVYGWSRIGLPSTNPNTADNTPDTNSNDSFIVTLVVKQQATGSDERIIEIPIGNAVDDLSYPPQTWKPGSARTGAYPVVYTAGTAEGFILDDQIISVSVKAASTSPTVMHIERVDIPEATMYVSDPTPKIEIVKVIPNQVLEAWDFTNDAQGWESALAHRYTNSWVAGELFCYQEGRGGFVGGNAIWRIATPKLYAATGATFTLSFNMGDAGNNWEVVTRATIRYTDDTYDEVQVSGTATTATATVMVGNHNKQVRYLEWYVGTPYGGHDRSLYSASIEGFNDAEYLAQNRTKNKMKINPRGAPVIFKSAVPYSAFNFEQTGTFEFSGPGSFVGLICFASDDEKNYVALRVSETLAQLIKVRGSRKTILKEEVIDIVSPVTLYFSHKDGYFQARLQNGETYGSTKILEHRWTEGNGDMVTNYGIMHVGIYTMIDVPKFRISSYGPSSDGIGMMGGYSMAAFEAFPSSGEITMGGYKYTYSGKTGLLPTVYGPFQLRNCGKWSYNNPDDGTNFSGATTDITMFQWLDGGTNKEIFKDYLLASSGGYNWLIKSIDWKAFTITRNQTVWLRNRCRVYCDRATGGSSADRIWITVGLTGVVAVDDASSHSNGSYCFLGSDNSIMLSMYTASNGNTAIVIEDIIERLTRMAGARATFPGDAVYPTIGFSAGETKEIL